tara:strand:- start:614 stop:781 length:168 start_codon:yes stop_codon:yes gene_type:complete
MCVNDYCFSNNGFEDMTIDGELYYDREKLFREYLDMICELNNNNNHKPFDKETFI